MERRVASMRENIVKAIRAVSRGHVSSYGAIAGLPGIRARHAKSSEYCALPLTCPGIGLSGRAGRSSCAEIQPLNSVFDSKLKA